MYLMEAEIYPVLLIISTETIKEATSQTIRDWVINVESTHYILGFVTSPHIYPMMVRNFRAIILNRKLACRL